MSGPVLDIYFTLMNENTVPVLSWGAYSLLKDTDNKQVSKQAYNYKI